MRRLLATACGLVDSVDATIYLELCHISDLTEGETTEHNILISLNSCRSSVRLACTVGSA